MTESSSAALNATQPSATQLLANLDGAAAVMLDKAATLSDDDVRSASALSGWTRGHVLAHLCGVANALARQFEYAVRGEKIAFYDGGYEGRTHAIEVAAGNGAAEHLRELTSALDRVLADMHGLADAGWQLPITYRDGVIYDGGLALWRELVIHLSDLELGRGPETWTAGFCSHLFDFLQARVPASLLLKLQPLGLPAFTLGHGGAGVRTVSVGGMLTDIAAWLAGRTPSLGSLRAEAAADAVDLPELLPWPAAIAPQ